METERIVHPLAPIWDSSSRVLILGSLPSPKSREAGMYYANPQNRFWRVLAALWEEEVPLENAARRDFCSRHRLALWDVIHSCTIAGASDASIRDVVPNDVSDLLAKVPIGCIFTTGGTAQRLFCRFLEKPCGMGAYPLPSTSPANARWRLPELIEAYRPVREAAESPEVR